MMFPHESVQLEAEHSDPRHAWPDLSVQDLNWIYLGR